MIINNDFFYSVSFMVGKICRVVNISSSSTELSVYVPKFYGQFQNDICIVVKSNFSGGLVFDMYEMSIALNADNSISGSPF